MRQTFQFAILDISVKLEEKKATLSAADVEDANYVIGMAVVNSGNLEKLIGADAAFWVENKASVTAFISDAKQFAASLKASGYGLAA